MTGATEGGLPRNVGPYELKGLLGGGAHGEVWRAEHVATGTAVAVKLLRDDAVHNAVTQLALFSEARALCQLDHPNVLRVLDFGLTGPQDQGAPYLVTELAQYDLSVVTPADWPQLRTVLEAVLAGLGHAHALQLVHQDLKPGNVLHTTDGSWKLADFGLVLALDEPIANVGGTRGYLSPEQLLRDLPNIGPRSDLFGVGAMTWSLLHAPRRLWPKGLLIGLHPRQTLEWSPSFAVPSALLGWVSRLVAASPDQRFASCHAAITALRQLDDPGAAVALPDQLPRRRTSTDPSLGLLMMRDPPLVGRAREQRALWQRLLAVSRNRKPQIVLIEGKPGAGRSRLASWLGHTAAELGGFTYLRARAESPGGPLAELVVQGERLRSFDTYEQLRVLRNRRGALGDALAAIISGEADGAAPLLASARAATVARWLHEVCGDSAVVVHLDDANRSAASMELARALADLGCSALLVATADPTEVRRPSVRSGWWRRLAERPDATLLSLAPLDPLAHSELVHALVGSGPTADRLLDETEHDPLLAVSLVRSWATRGLLRATATGIHAPDDAGWPADVTAVWEDGLEAFIQTAAPDGRQSIDLARAIGRRVSLGVWARAARQLGLPDPAELGARLVAHGLMEAEGTVGGLRWSHSSLALTAADPDIHRACAAAFKATGGDPATVGGHLLAAGDRAAAVPQLLAAARERLVLGRAGSALSVLALTREAGPDGALLQELRHLRARAWAMLGELERAEHDAQLLDERGAGLRGRIALHRGQTDEAELHFKEAIRQARDAADARAQARGWLGLARTLLARGRHAEAHAAVIAADDVLDGPPDAALQSTRTWLAGELALVSGEPSVALDAFEAAAAVVANPLRQLVRARCLEGTGEARAALRDVAGAEVAFQQALALHAALGTPSERAQRGLAAIARR